MHQVYPPIYQKNIGMIKIIMSVTTKKYQQITWLSGDFTLAVPLLYHWHFWNLKPCIWETQDINYKVLIGARLCIIQVPLYLGFNFFYMDACNRYGGSRMTNGIRSSLWLCLKLNIRNTTHPNTTLPFAGAAWRFPVTRWSWILSFTKYPEVELPSP